MANVKIRTSSETESRWEARITIGEDELEVRINGERLAGVDCPSIESLARRYEASDKSWLSSWLADESDPTEPTRPY